MKATNNMNVFVSHMYREGNTCACGLANLALAQSTHVWFPAVLDCIRAEFVRNRLGLPNYRLSLFEKVLT